MKVIAARLGKTEGAVMIKMGRLRLNVVVAKAPTTTTLKLPRDLPSFEEALRILAGALSAATKAGLNKVEV